MTATPPPARLDESLTLLGRRARVVFDDTLRKIGAERLMFAIDYPYKDSQVPTSFVGALDLTDEQRTLVSHANAEWLFRIATPDQHR